MGAKRGACAPESAAGQPPIDGYDEMNVEEITEQLDCLSEAELVRVSNYERRNKNRETLLEQIERCACRVREQRQPL